MKQQQLLEIATKIDAWFGFYSFRLTPRQAHKHLCEKVKFKWVQRHFITHNFWREISQTLDKNFAVRTSQISVQHFQMEQTLSSLEQT